MTTLTLQIHRDEAYSFLMEYDKLGKDQKEIFKITRWWCNRFPCAAPSQKKIAEKIGCSRKHVNRTFAKFKQLGWLYLTSRGLRRTKILGMPLHLCQMDVAKREYFKRVEVTSKVTYSYSRYRNITGMSGKVVRKNLEIPKLAQKLGYSKDSSLKLALVPECVLQETLYQCKKLGKKGFRPNNEESYFVGMALKMAKKKGHKLDWRSYYATKASM